VKVLALPTLSSNGPAAFGEDQSEVLLVDAPIRRGALRSAVAEAADAARLRRENERLQLEVERRVRELHLLNDRLERTVAERTQALLTGLVAALDYRDAATQSHSRRVSLYARRLAEQLRIPEPEASVIERGALLHDIGKIAVPDSILRKHGSLTESDWAEMRKHPQHGWALLQGAEYLRSASIIVVQHHERWDGKGYPAGRAGEEIVVGARIFAVVDAFDAMTSNRPYRGARSYECARTEIASCSGKQFEPGVVEAFLDIRPEELGRIRLEAQGAPPFPSEARA